MLVAFLLIWRKQKRRHMTALEASPKPDDDEEEEMSYYGNLPSRSCEPEPIYANTVPRKSLSASRNFEVSEKYSTIKKPKARF